MQIVSTTTECLVSAPKYQYPSTGCPNTTIVKTIYDSTVIVSNNTTITERVLTVTKTDSLLSLLQSNSEIIGAVFFIGIIVLTVFLFRRRSNQ